MDGRFSVRARPLGCASEADTEVSASTLKRAPRPPYEWMRASACCASEADTEVPASTLKRAPRPPHEWTRASALARPLGCASRNLLTPRSRVLGHDSGER